MKFDKISNMFYYLSAFLLLGNILSIMYFFSITDYTIKAILISLIPLLGISIFSMFSFLFMARTLDLIYEIRKKQITSYDIMELILLLKDTDQNKDEVKL